MSKGKGLKLLGSMMAAALATGKIFERTPFYRISNAVTRRKFSRGFYSRTNCNCPHQSTRECSRRLRQIAAGTLQMF